MLPTGDVQLKNRSVEVTPFFEFEPGVDWRDLEQIAHDRDAFHQVSEGQRSWQVTPYLVGPE